MTIREITVESARRAGMSEEEIQLRLDGADAFIADGDVEVSPSEAAELIAWFTAVLRDDTARDVLGERGAQLAQWLPRKN